VEQRRRTPPRGPGSASAPPPAATGPPATRVPATAPDTESLTVEEKFHFVLALLPGVRHRPRGRRCVDPGDEGLEPVHIDCRAASHLSICYWEDASLREVKLVRPARCVGTASRHS
jgi:hypothetical protein